MLGASLRDAVRVPDARVDEQAELERRIAARQSPKAAEWRREYDANQPHSSLDNLSPEEFARPAKNHPEEPLILEPSR